MTDEYDPHDIKWQGDEDSGADTPESIDDEILYGCTYPECGACCCCYEDPSDD